MKAKEINSKDKERKGKESRWEEQKPTDGIRGKTRE